MREAEHGPAWLVQAALIARRFYLEGSSKIEIADELGLSRFKVARILDEARELGLVQVTVRLPTRIDADLSTALQRHFALRRAIVVERQAADTPPRSDLGRVAAQLLTELVTAEDVLGLTCSRSVAAATDSLHSLATCQIVQLTGTLAGPDLDSGSVESVRRAAAAGGGKAFPIYAPMLLPDAATARALRGETAISRALEQIHGVTIAMVAIGAWEAGLSTVWETVDDADRAAAAAVGAVGEIGARLFDQAGQALTSPIDERVLGVTLEQLRSIPEVIALAYDARRADAVRAVLTSGLVDTLVCDADLGRALVDQAPQHGDPMGVSA